MDTGNTSVTSVGKFSNSSHKNQHDRQHEMRILNNRSIPITSRNIGEIRRNARQLMRAWAKAGRCEYGYRSVASYCEIYGNVT